MENKKKTRNSRKKNNVFKKIFGTLLFRPIRWLEDINALITAGLTIPLVEKVRDILGTGPYFELFTAGSILEDRPYRQHLTFAKNSNFRQKFKFWSYSYFRQKLKFS